LRPTDWDEKYRAAERLWTPTPNLYVADRLAHHPPGSGLDLASGEGRNAVWLAEKGWRMTGVDFSEVALERARAASESVRWELADVRAWDPDETFDLVLVAYLQMVEDELRDVIRRAVAWLDDGGEIFLIGHDLSNLDHGHGGPQMPEVLWEVDSIRSWLEDLAVVEAQVVRRPVETAEGVKLARDALIRARRI
jgi:SAM-dependent methyltransferase